MLDNATPQDLSPMSMFISTAGCIVCPIYIVKQGRRVWRLRCSMFDFHAGDRPAIFVLPYPFTIFALTTIRP